jgi:hypothetical protein
VGLSGTPTDEIGANAASFFFQIHAESRKGANFALGTLKRRDIVPFGTSAAEMGGALGNTRVVTSFGPANIDGVKKSSYHFCLSLGVARSIAVR